LQQDLTFALPPGLPSELLTRRPDIREAEQNLRSANAQVGVAVANFFPTFSLTALFGQVSPEMSAFTSGAANAWSLGAGLTGPLFQGGRLRAQHRQALAAREQAALTYQQTVLAALQAVSNDLIAVRRYGEQRARQARAVRAYEVAFRVSLQRYLAGLASYYEVLQQQQQLFPAENSLVQAELNQFLSFIQLYQDLGGGFEEATQGGRGGS
jgi:multidrug efflux system outer membrane protein